MFSDLLCGLMLETVQSHGVTAVLRSSLRTDVGNRGSVLGKLKAEQSHEGNSCFKIFSEERCREQRITPLPGRDW
jgi:hypothetical protein